MYAQHVNTGEDGREGFFKKMRCSSGQKDNAEKMCPFQRKYEHHVRCDFFSVVKGAVNMAHLQLVHVWILFRTYTMLDITNIIVLRQILFKECTISLFLFLLAHYAASFWPQ